jgi:hypothetical protein
MINDCENKEETREMFTPEDRLKMQEEDEDVEGTKLPDRFNDVESRETRLMIQEAVGNNREEPSQEGD